MHGTLLVFEDHVTAYDLIVFYREKTLPLSTSKNKLDTNPLYVNREN